MSRTATVYRLSHKSGETLEASRRYRITLEVKLNGQLQLSGRID
jgi:hypothetical protein